MSSGEEFSIRNVVCDYYLESQNVLSVRKYGRHNHNVSFTVMRIFGISETGEKCCAHIHGFLPYIIFRTKTGLTSELRAYFYNMIKEIIALTQFGKMNLCVDTQVVYDIVEEQAKCIYAFQRECTANAFNAFLQPYNAHIPTILQFFIDFSIYGMDSVNFSRRYMRTTTENLSSSNSPLKPLSRVAVEFDAFIDDILNPFHATKSRFNMTGLKFIWEEEKRRCELLGLQLDAPTPGLAGLPELSTEREDALRRQLGSTLKRIEELFNAERSTSATLQPVQDVSQRLLQRQTQQEHQEEQHLLSQQVVNELKSHFFAGGVGVETDSDAAILVSENRWQNQEIDVDDANENLENIDEAVVDEEKSKQQNVDEENAICLSSDDSDLEMVFTGKKESDVGKGVNQEGTSRSDLTKVVQAKEESRKLVVRPRVHLPIRLYCCHCPADGAVKSCAVDGTSIALGVQNRLSDPPDNLKKPRLLLRALNETWNVGDSLADTPSMLDESAAAPSPQRSDTQQAYSQMMRTVRTGVDNLCVLSVEILAFSAERGNGSIADPALDGVAAIFYVVNTDVCNSGDNNTDGNDVLREFAGILATDILDVKNASPSAYSSSSSDRITYVRHEMQLFAELTNVVHRYDPDILIGYDSTRFSWGYLFERARALDLPFLNDISRVRGVAMRKGRECFPPPHGRIMLEVWRVLRRECAWLRSYRFSSVVKALLNRNFPDFDEAAVRKLLLFNINNGEPRPDDQHWLCSMRCTVLQYYLSKCRMNIRLLDNINLFIKTSQMARVYGIQFVEVLTRGSQFRVESILLRLARKNGFVAPSMSALQRNLMGSPETIPLNLEPESGIYYDPVVVLDFQSLYPSVCIAYNYCFTTCLGKLSRLKALVKDVEQGQEPSGSFPHLKLGALDGYALPDIGWLRRVLAEDGVNVSPTGGVFLKAEWRRGLLAQMLQELLDTRVMVKKSMRTHQHCQSLQRLLEARQLALKLVANVTYGYTAANWSGRMPCEELADAIVAKGREALERAIDAVDAERVERGGGGRYGRARVIYGDTDSLFVLFQGHSRCDAFRLGALIADDVSAQNPYPMKLKFEKVMQPCALLTKKRYVGMSYICVEQSAGEFDAKGIETVRRDACPFVAKTVERVLRLIFDDNAVPDVTGGRHGGGLDAVFHYLKYRLAHLDDVPPVDFVLSAEYRERYADSTVIPVKRVAERLTTSFGARATPLRGERVDYLITAVDKSFTDGAASAEGDEASAENSRSGYVDPFAVVAVTENAVHAGEFFRGGGSSGMEINYDYYVQRQLFPALQRFFQFVGGGVRLRWRCGESSRRQRCLGCLQPNAFPWCMRCVRDADTLLLRRLMQTRQLYVTRRQCADCVQRAVETRRCHVDDTAQRSSNECANYACTVHNTRWRASTWLSAADARRHVHARPVASALAADDRLLFLDF